MVSIHTTLRQISITILSAPRPDLPPMDKMKLKTDNEEAPYICTSGYSRADEQTSRQADKTGAKPSYHSSSRQKDNFESLSHVTLQVHSSDQSQGDFHYILRSVATSLPICNPPAQLPFSSNSSMAASLRWNLPSAGRCS
jgi:hypothetical protein